MTTPGPGSYVVKAELQKVGNNTVIGRERGREKEDLEKRQIPGPGIYKAPDAKVLFKHTGNTTIGKAERKGMITEGAVLTPGPGTYKEPVHTKRVKPPSYGMGTGPKDVKDLSSSKSVPGPGLYDQSVKRTRVGAAIGNDSRFKEKKNEVPGPGSYRLPPLVGSVAPYHNIGRTN